LNEGDSTKKIATKKKGGHPGDAADKIVANKFWVVHGADAGDKGSKGADNGDKTGQDDSFAAVFLVKNLSLAKMLFFEETVIFFKNFRAKKMTNPIVDGVTKEGGNDQQDKKKRNTE